MGAQSVFYVHPDQISKQANPGEYLTKGAFMIRGKTNYIENKIDLAIGKLEDGRLMAAPETAIVARCKEYVRIRQGSRKVAEIAKKRKNLEFMVNPEKGIVLAMANASEMASHALRRWDISSREVVILNFRCIDFCKRREVIIKNT